MASDKKISVIMGIRNCADTLPEAIESIILQTYPNWELIMCDDASTDETYLVADAYREQFPEKIKLIRNEENSYLSYSLNHCLQYATGELVARMDGDDISLPERFEKEVAYLAEHPGVDLVGCFMQQFCGSEMLRVIPKVEHPDRFTLKTAIPFHHATIMTYKRVYDELGGYTVNDRTRRCEDYDLWFRFYVAGFVGANLQECLYHVRENQDAIRRRTLQTRWNAFVSTCIGFKMLDYPKIWLVRPFAEMIGKSMVPTQVWMWYRKWQGWRDGRGNGGHGKS